MAASLLRSRIVVALLAILSIATASADDKAAPAEAPALPPAYAPPQLGASQLVVPHAEHIVILVRTALLSLNDALQTGNFTVMRDLAAPGFREANTAGRLAQTFSDLNRRGINLAAVATITPQLSESPTVDQAAGMLRIKGRFPGSPVAIEFDLAFQSINGFWRLFGLSVNPVSTVTDTAAAQPVPAASTAKEAGKSSSSRPPQRAGSSETAKPSPVKSTLNGSEKATPSPPR